MIFFINGGGGGSEGFHTSFFFFQTPFRIIFFSAEKFDEKNINRDFIKEGRGVSPFYGVISQKIFNLTKDGFP